MIDIDRTAMDDPKLHGDQVLASRLTSALRGTSHRELWHLDCESQNGVIYLKGTVTTYHMKQLAQEIARRVDGVRKIINRVEVKYNSD